jgi:hypothetical protein
MDAQAIQLLQSAAGTVYLLTVTAVAIRLLVLARRNRELPELLLGLSLLVGGTFGASLEAGGMAAASTLEDPKIVGTMLLSGKLFGLVALVCQGLFIWKVFRPEAAWAPAIVAVCFACSAAALTGFWQHGTFATGEIPIHWFWVELAGRTTGSIWLVAEAIHFYGQIQKRRELGLADPVLCNRFLLWAVAGVCGLVMMLTAVPPVVSPNSSHPLMAWDLVVFGAAGIGFSIAYSLVFFPPQRYLRWVGGRTAEATS